MIEYLTQNQDRNSWVDLVPGAVSTGYQAQNTNIEAARNGLDLSTVTYDAAAAEIVLLPSGPIDVNGALVVIKEEMRIAFSNVLPGKYFLKVIPAQNRTFGIEIVNAPGDFIPEKNSNYENNDRILNWILSVNAPESFGVSPRVFVVKQSPQPQVIDARYINFPIGFIYPQYPGGLSPSEMLWMGTWTAQFESEGVFFRTPGNGAASFGEYQADQFQDHRAYTEAGHGWHRHNINEGGEHYHAIDRGQGTNAPTRSNVETLYNASGEIYTKNSGEHTHTMDYNSLPAMQSTAVIEGDGGTPRTGDETRPKNRTFRLWKKTAA